jgi:hypothetical protein
MISVLRIIVIHAWFLVGIFLITDNNVVMVAQAFTSRSTIITTRNPMKHIISNQPTMNLSILYSSTKDKSDATSVTYNNNVESSIISALDMSLQQPSEVSNDRQQQQAALIVVKPQRINPLVEPVIETLLSSSSSSSVPEESIPSENKDRTDVSTVAIDVVQAPPPPPPLSSELNIWAARGLLLLVAAIWGTNFAVRLTHFWGVMT